MKPGFVLLLLFLMAIVIGCVEEAGQEPAPATDKTIDITAAGFNPDKLIINAGDMVTFVNIDNVPHWPATDPHPGHNQYPEHFEQVPSGCFKSKFDACRPLQQGETFSFTFNLTGTWTFHDHLNPPLKGTIIVQ